MKTQSTRRRFVTLLCLSGVSVGLGGCSAGDFGEASNSGTARKTDRGGFIRPERDPRTVPEELRCEDEDFERRSGWIAEKVLQWGTLTDDEGNQIFTLRVDTLSVERGEAVTFTQTNVSSQAQTTGNVHKSNFDVYSKAGWQDPRGWPDGLPKPINDDVWNFEPGEKYQLTFELTEGGDVNGLTSPHRDDLITCPALPAGRYRFGTAAPEQGDVAVAFDVVE